MFMGTVANLLRIDEEPSPSKYEVEGFVFII